MLAEIWPGHYGGRRVPRSLKASPPRPPPSIPLPPLFQRTMKCDFKESCSSFNAGSSLSLGDEGEPAAHPRSPASPSGEQLFTTAQLQNAYPSLILDSTRSQKRECETPQRRTRSLSPNTPMPQISPTIITVESGIAYQHGKRTAADRQRPTSAGHPLSLRSPCTEGSSRISPVVAQSPPRAGSCSVQRPVASRPGTGKCKHENFEIVHASQYGAAVRRKPPEMRAWAGDQMHISERPFAQDLSRPKAFSKAIRKGRRAPSTASELWAQDELTSMLCGLVQVSQISGS